MAKENPFRKEISSLKTRLTNLNEEKNASLRDKRVFSKELFELIRQIKELKNKNDEENRIIGEHKVKRDECNKEVRQLASELRLLNNQKEEFYKKQNIKIDPKKLKEKIAKLEESIEIEGYSFKEEQKVMEQIKRLKRLYSEFSAVISILEKIENLSKQLKEKREKAREHHDRLIELSKSDTFNNFIRLSKKINGLKAEQEKYAKKYLEKKNEYVKINQALNDRLLELNKQQKEMEEKRKKRDLDRKKIEEINLSKKMKSVEEKLKKEKKLTTEDLLVFQGK